MKLLVSIFAIFLAVSAAVTVGISDDITVSGLSSGAFMAVQMHVANSATIKGAGVFAGGPFYCAQGQVATALTTCMSIGTGINLAGIKQEISTLASQGKIDDPSNLSGSKVFVFSGTADSTVKPAVNHATVDFYEGYSAKVKEEFSLAAGHTMPTVDKGIACGSTQSPYIGKCDYNGAYEALKHLHPEQVTNEPGTSNPSNLFKVTQSGGSAAVMGSQAYLYVPDQCQSADAGCSLHVVFHGCQQTTADIGEKYETDTGYNEVAETNDMVILYPQATKQVLKNPNGCWDWWGYTDGTSFLPSSKTYHTKEGKQMKVVKTTIDSISKGTAKLVRVEENLVKE